MGTEFMQRRLALAATAAVVSAPARALYDPKPSPLLALAPGGWAGTLTYRDWSNPEKLVTLPCQLKVALSSPEELTLFYVFDDGPGKVVYSYERMSFDFSAKTLTWLSGVSKPSTEQYTITSSTASAEETQLDFEHTADGRTDKYAFTLTRKSWSMTKVEHDTSGRQTFRNKYEFQRSEG
ncbi:hypothetical protein AACH06_18790 [Ideonella sp. DXS29W]|uniref:DUF1579 domain-containing protein n=1 Tax=Ideonella lacteola TaxID=2984193 RepID=A0ABU9BSC1_9BURK